MNGITNLRGAALIERGQANVAWVKAHLPALVAAAAATQETFAEKLSKAVKTVTGRPRANFVATASGPAEEAFAEKLRKAVAARLPTSRTVKQAQEQAERERARYRKPVRRERTKGE